MSSRAKIAISLSQEVLSLLAKHAHGRSRSRAIEEELIYALRAREWERLSAQMSAADFDDLTDDAASTWAMTDTQLFRAEKKPRRKRS
jgi:hypothetical protein